MPDPNPFVPRTTEVIEKANRLMALRENPGYNDLFRISTVLVEEATANLIDYGGWDKDQIAVLKARAQAAKEHHQALFARMFEAISAGVNEARGVVNDREKVEQSDQLRAAALSTYDSDMRVAGSH
jgi:hypothetical protein